MAPGWIIALVFLGILLYVGLIIGIIYGARNLREIQNKASQHLLTDYDLIHLINNEPDNMMTTKRLTAKSNLNKQQARRRLRYLYYSGLLNVFQDPTFARHYTLKQEVKGAWLPDLSDRPFLTVEDILLLFKHYDYKVTLQDVCLSTKLPVSIIKREFDYFIKEKVIQKIKPVAPMSFTHQYVLQEPYRSSPESFLRKKDELDLELENLYVKVWTKKEK